MSDSIDSNTSVVNSTTSLGGSTPMISIPATSSKKGPTISLTETVLKQRVEKYIQLNHFSAALPLCEQLLNQYPGQAYLLAIKGWCLHKLDRHDEAKPLILSAIQQAPEVMQVAKIAFRFLVTQALFEELVDYGRRCLEYHPDDANAWHQIGTAYYFLGERRSATQAFRRSLSLADTGRTATNLALSLLCEGQYTEGFRLYEQRTSYNPKLDWIGSERFPAPRWQGEDIQDKHILCWTEQGLGDAIQFIRFIKVLAEKGARVDVLLQPAHRSLHELFSTIDGIRRVYRVDRSQVKLSGSYDYHCSSMSLMYHLGLQVNSIPSCHEYIRLPRTYQQALTQHTQRLLGDQSHRFLKPLLASSSSVIPRRYKIGIVWTTTLSTVFDKNNPLSDYLKDKKNLTLLQLSPLFRSVDADFLSLQYPVSEEDRVYLANNAIADASANVKSFTDTAVLITSLDMVVGIDTSVIHLAAAMGKPTLNLLPWASDWRWQERRDDTPWYPTMQLCRQTYKDDWDGVVRRAVTIVRQYLQSQADSKEGE